MNPLIFNKGILGLVLAFGLIGGGMMLVLNELNDLDATGPGRKSATVNELLKDQNPGQISYISFPITEPFPKQLKSHRKSIPFPGERYRYP